MRALEPRFLPLYRLMFKATLATRTDQGLKPTFGKLEIRKMRNTFQGPRRGVGKKRHKVDKKLHAKWKKSIGMEEVNWHGSHTAKCCGVRPWNESKESPLTRTVTTQTVPRHQEKAEQEGNTQPGRTDNSHTLYSTGTTLTTTWKTRKAATSLRRGRQTTQEILRDERLLAKLASPQATPNPQQSLH